MSRERNLGRVALIAGCVVLLASCGGNEVARSAASATPAMATPSSSGAAASSLSPEASATVLGMSPELGIGLARSTKVCVENRSSVTPDVTVPRKDQQSGEGLLKFGATACASGKFILKGNMDVVVKIDVPAPNAPMEFGANNPDIGYPSAVLAQYGAGKCLSFSYAVGESHTWFDGLLMYVVEREPDAGGKVFRVTIENSKNPSVDGKPAKC